MGNAASFIEKLPANYGTSLTKYFEYDATELSIGQWQKIAISRAFYSSSDILILDEPTASLDAIAEQEIFDQFAALADGRMTVLVSHRLSSAVDADRILVLEEGRLVEEGTHTALLARGGTYHRLFTTQAKNYRAE